ncbi:MAG: hypothetical protein U0640_12715 [Phycisphaerales bacterium]
MSQRLSRAFTLPQLCASSWTTAAVLFLFQGCAQSAPQQPQQSAPAAMTHTSAQSTSQDAAPAAAAASEDDWKAAESSHLVNAQQLTFAKDYVKAGEAYFDPTSQWVIFQAVARPTPGVEADPFYAMYVGRLMRAMPESKVNVNEGTGTHFALMDSQRISPRGSANTCGWFHPTQPGMIVMGSTLTTPKNEAKSGFQVGTRRYVWMFPEEMEVVTQRLNFMTASKGTADAPNLMFSRPKYDAECSYDKSGRFVIYTHVEESEVEAKPDGNLYIFDTKTQKHHPIVIAPGYDGGPFFSPDGKSICYRSDRKGNDLLQLFVADLKFEKDADGTMIPVGIEREWQITNDENVNWAPYWHPNGKTLVYASSAVAHTNYEVFAITLDWNKLRALPKDADAAASAAICTPWRVTHAPGADVLPAFSPDGKWLMWTSQRGEKIEGEAKPSSQLWIAEWRD